MALPNSFALYTTYKTTSYVQYINEDVSEHGFLSISGLDVVSPFTKFEMVPAKNGAGLVNIRCCYNGKYWVKSSEDDSRIVASASHPEEDQSKWSCTLFEPIFEVYEGAEIVKFLHANLKYYVNFLVAARTEDSWLYIAEELPGTAYWDKFSITDWDSMMILPKYVMFKGDNGDYLYPRAIDSQQFIKFVADKERDDSMMVFEVVTTHDGSVKLKCADDWFWKRNSDNWILLADPKILTGIDLDLDLLFWPMKVEKYTVALRNMGNKCFCKRLTDFTDRLSPVDSDISLLAHLEVEEPVTSRRIRVSKYCIHDWICKYSSKEIVFKEVVNNTDKQVHESLKFSFIASESSCWNSIASLKLESVPIILEADVHPFIEEEHIKLLSRGVNELYSEYKWGETITTETPEEEEYELTVLPRSKVTVTLITKIASYVVPFSYSQVDTLSTGNEITLNMEDGVYTATNYLNYQFETHEENI